MPPRGRDALNLGAALIALLVTLMAMLVPLGTARAANSCTPSDLWNGLENAVGTIASGTCTSVCSDSYECLAAGVVSVGLAGASADTGQGAINQVCAALQNAVKDVTSGGNDAKSVLGFLNQYAPSLSQDVQQQLASALSSIADPLDVALCGCSIEQGLGQLTADLGSCLQDVLCAGDAALFGDPCTCTAPPPVMANCAQSNSTNCGSFNSNDAACLGEGPQGNVILAGPNGQTLPGSEPVNVITGPAGTIVTSGGVGSDGHGHCAPVSVCTCPQPMVPTWTQDYVYGLANGFQVDGPQVYIFSCNCPAGTHTGGTVNGTSVCLCDGTNLAPQPPDTFGGMCPPASCSPQQISLGGKCVTPCSNPAEGMTADGACCDPAQVTSCGMCCPPGTTPDPTSGSCVKPQVPQ
jgi:hypothetical protein